jgi:hypothetical protein
MIGGGHAGPKKAETSDWKTRQEAFQASIHWQPTYVKEIYYEPMTKGYLEQPSIEQNKYEYVGFYF